MKPILSPEVARFIVIIFATVALAAPLGGTLLAQASPMLAYRYADSIWMLWLCGNLGALIWSAIYFKKEPLLRKISLVVVAASVLAGLYLPRL